MAKTTFIKEERDNRLFNVPFVTESAKELLSAGFNSGGIKVLPGLSSSDTRYLDFLRELVAELNDECRAEIVNRCVTGKCYGDDFDRVLTAAGFRMKPVGYVVHDNSSIIAEKGMPTDFRDEGDRAIFKQLIDIMFGRAHNGGIKVANHSSSGLPHRTYEKTDKIEQTLNILENSHVSGISDAIIRSDGEKLIRDYGICFAYVINYRLQADKPSKTRYVLDYANLKRGEYGLIPGDKTVVINDRVVEGINACRTRIVKGFNQPLNALISVYTTSCANVYLNRYQFTWKHRGHEDMEEKVNYMLGRIPNGHLYGIDVTQFDNSVPRFLMDEFQAYLGERYLSKEYNNIMWKARYAPVYQPESGDGMGACWHGDPLDLELLESPGVSSGLSVVSGDGKLFNVFNHFVILKSFTSTEYVLDNMHRILDGFGDHTLCLNAGDDQVNVSVIPEEQWIDHANKYGYFQLESEPVTKFLGEMFALQEDGSIKLVPDITSFLIHNFVPERAYTSRLRPYWFVGLAERMRVYSRHPSFQEVLDIVDRVFGKHYPKYGSFRGYVEHVLEEHKYDGPQMTSWADSIYIANPAAVHYKIDIDDVSEELLDRDYSRIGAEDVEHLFGVHILCETLDEQDMIDVKNLATQWRNYVKND